MSKDRSRNKGKTKNTDAPAAAAIGDTEAGKEILSKLFFNPVSVTYAAIRKTQKVDIEVTNNNDVTLFVKTKNTNMKLFAAKPNKGKILPRSKESFKLFFLGYDADAAKAAADKEAEDKAKANPTEPPPVPRDHLAPLKKQRFSFCLFQAGKNANYDRVMRKGGYTVAVKHQVPIKFVGIEEKEQQQPSVNEEEDDKDRQGQMRAKSKDTAKDPKKPTVMIITRKDGDSGSDEEDDDGKTSPSGQSDDMKTTLPAGNFTGQVATNEAGGAPKSEFRTTRPAGNFTGQVASNETGGEGGQKSNFKTTKPAGEFQNQVTPNGGENQNMKTTKPAGSFDNPQRSNQ
uniref:MSP domain-containing protein n=1 Tax=Caenorhabditis tropicalis TaxID=1561998 RepID=A0A1I7UHI3_9PELO